MKHLLLVPVIAAVVLVSHPTSAAAQGKLDHMLCYGVTDKLKPDLTASLKAELQPEFSQANCTVVKVTKFCIPVTKTILPPGVPPLPFVGQPLRNDYVCYQIKCEKDPANPNGVSGKFVADQFGQHTQKIVRPFELCAPARKNDQPCHRIGTGKKCGGVCPFTAATVAGQSCRFDETLQDCTCAPQDCGGKPDTTGHCGGACPDPLQTCLPGVDAAGKKSCVCQGPKQPPCGLNAATGTCGGTCADPAAACVFVTTTSGPDCICQPPVPQCQHVSGAAQCTGPCPPGLKCLLNPAINDCRCEPPTPNCGPNPLTGQCGGTCPAGTECRFSTTAGAAGCACQ